MPGGIYHNGTFGWEGGQDVARADEFAHFLYRLVRFLVRSPTAPRNVIVC